MKQPPPSAAADAGKKNRQFVVATFCASLALFFAAGAYDYIRPYVRPHIISVLEFFVASIEPWIVLPRGTCTVASNDGQSCTLHSPTEKAAFLGIASELFLLPTLLSVLPLTHWWKRAFIATRDPRAACGHPLDESASIQGVKVCSLLFIIAWMLWVVSAAALLLGILLGPSVVGIISVAALLAFFAQVVCGVGCLLLASDEDDDIRRETQSVGESITLVSATVWVQSSPKSKRRQGKEEEPRDGQHRGRKPLAQETSSPTDCQSEGTPGRNASTSVPALCKSRSALALQGKNREFLLFFSMKMMLIQTPYAMQIGLHFLHTCASCIGRNHHSGYSVSEDNAILGKEISGAVAFLVTLLVPLFTHGVGGILFNGSRWKFHHPFHGGTSHVTAQATGWSLVGIAGLLHLAFLMLDTRHVYLLHSGSILSTVAEGLLLYSLINFLPGKETTKSQTKNILRDALKAKTCTCMWIIPSFIQDVMITNLHWFCPVWFMCTLLGFDKFHPFPATSTSLILANAISVAFICALPTLLIDYTPRRKQWKWNLFGRINDAFCRFLFHPMGLFSGSELKFEENNLEEYTRGGAMFAMAPHGTLPTSVVAVCHQFQNIFSDVCAFFGSQVSLVPNYRFLLGMQGGFVPVEKKRLVEVMHTRQNVALVPGGVSEMLSCVPNGKTINVSIKHKGFVRIAMQHGYDLVPTFFFHANDQYNNPARVLQLWTYKMTGVPMGVPLYTNRWGAPISNATPIRVALGNRLPVERNPSPSAEEVDAVHRLFYEEVLRVWDKYKDEFGYADRELAYVT